VRQRTPTQNLYGRSDINQGDADGATNSRTGATGALGNLQGRAEHFPAATNCGSERLARNLSAACVAARVVNDRFDGGYQNRNWPPDWLNGTYPTSSMTTATLGLFLLQLIDQIDQVGPSRAEPSWFPMRCDIEAYGITTGSP
jgi:hypothetical protein